MLCKAQKLLHGAYLYRKGAFRCLHEACNGFREALSGLSDLRSVAAESEICFKTHRFGSAELNSIREELLNVSLDFQCSYLKL